MKHELKILPAYYEAVLSGDKTFEIRFNDDRGFQKGDSVLLLEISPPDGLYTGRELLIKITYVTNYAQKDGYVVFAFKKVEASHE